MLFKFQLSIFCIAFLMLLGLRVEAQSKFISKFHPDSLTQRKLSFIPIPVIQSSPETGLKMGLALDYFFNTGTTSDDAPKTRDSYAWVQGLYSVRRQLALEAFWQIYTTDEKWHLRNRSGYINFNEHYWGVGNFTVPEKDYTDFFYKRVFVTGKVLRQASRNIFVGSNYNFSDTWAIRFVGGFAENTTFGQEKDPTRISGIGPNVIFDFRDNPFSPVRGWYLELGSHHYRSPLGSRSVYDEYLVDARKYFRVFERDFFGVQFIGNFTSGDVPFRELTRLGGPNMMRGFFQGRYRDRQHVAFQAEYRKPLNRFLKIAAFASTGQVFADADDFKWHQMRFAGGLGARVLINKSKNIYSRLDFAITDQGTSGFYFRIADAF